MSLYLIWHRAVELDVRLRSSKIAISLATLTICVSILFTTGCPAEFWLNEGSYWF